MTDREIMQMALETLEDIFGKNKVDVGAINALRAQLEQPDRQALQAEGKHPAPCARHCEAKAFEIEIRGLKSALRAALEQPAEPVAWMYSDDHERMLESETFCTVYSVKVGSPDKGVTDVPLYTHPPQRKPLTEEEIKRLLPVNGSWFEFARAIEQAHGIK